MSANERKRRKRIRQYVIARDGTTCCYCNLSLLEEQITLDHIIPASKRGTFNATNLTVACGDCNSKRGSEPFLNIANCIILQKTN